MHHKITLNNYTAMENTYTDIKNRLQNIVKITEIEDFQNRRRGFKNYIMISYISITRPQWFQEDWVKYPYKTMEERTFILETLKNTLDKPCTLFL